MLEKFAPAFLAGMPVITKPATATAYVAEPGSASASSECDVKSIRDWAFAAQPNSAINGRVMPLSMGKVLGDGSSITVMVWSRGH